MARPPACTGRVAGLLLPQHNDGACGGWGGVGGEVSGRAPATRGARPSGLRLLPPRASRLQRPTGSAVCPVSPPPPSFPPPAPSSTTLPATPWPLRCPPCPSRPRRPPPPSPCAILLFAVALVPVCPSLRSDSSLLDTLFSALGRERWRWWPFHQITSVSGGGACRTRGSEVSDALRRAPWGPCRHRPRQRLFSPTPSGGAAVPLPHPPPFPFAHCLAVRSW